MFPNSRPQVLSRAADVQIMSSQTLGVSSNTARQVAGKYLTFTIQNESYGIDVLKVREIIRLTDITAVPQMPAYIKGVINLRGKIIPVLDLRSRFGFPETSTDLTCIVVVQVKLPDGKNTQMGLVVDGVEEVTNIAPGDIEAPPRLRRADFHGLHHWDGQDQRQRQGAAEH